MDASSSNPSFPPSLAYYFRTRSNWRKGEARTYTRRISTLYPRVWREKSWKVARRGNSKGSYSHRFNGHLEILLFPGERYFTRLDRKWNGRISTRLVLLENVAYSMHRTESTTCLDEPDRPIERALNGSNSSICTFSCCDCSRNEGPLRVYSTT